MDSDNQNKIYCAEDDEYRIYCDICDKFAICDKFNIILNCLCKWLNWTWIW